MNKYDFMIQKTSFSKNLIRITIICICVFLCLIIPLNLIIYSINQSKINSSILSEKQIQELLLANLNAFQSNINSDIKVLKDDSIFENYLSESSLENKILLEKRLLQFVKYKDYYSQIRYIDLEGMEVIRVNNDSNGIYLVDKVMLQNKSNRYYFNEILDSSPNELYVSDLDLNIENNKIELPISPMIRVGSKVYSKGGVLKGILVLNHKAKPLIDGFMKLNDIRGIYNYYIIDKYGNYLFHKNPNYTWGNYFTYRKNFNSQTNYLILEMNPKNSYVQNKDNLYVYTHLSNFNKIENPDVIFVTEIPKYPYKLLTLKNIIKSLLLWILVSLIVFLIYDQLKLKAHMHRIINIICHGIEQNPVVAILTDDFGNIVYVNDAFEKLTGYSFYEVYNKNPNILKSGDMNEEKYKEMWQTIRNGDNWNGELYNKCKDGSYYWADARISPIFNKRGKIDHFFALQTNITRKKNIFEKYQDLALKDPLTGAFNRNVYSLDENKDLIEKTLSQNKSIIFMIDIDHFKKINDKYGHDIGDEILEKMVEHINFQVRDDDFVIRYGGEEFLLILSIKNIKNGLDFGERLRLHFVNNDIITSQGKIPVRISIGMTRPKCNKEEIGLVIKRADQALYEAKNTGRNKLVYKE